MVGARKSIEGACLRSPEWEAEVRGWTLNMRKSPKLSLLALALVVVLAWLFPELREPFGVGAEPGAPAQRSELDRTAPPPAPIGTDVDRTIGFRSQSALDEHFDKHGA